MNTKLKVREWCFGKMDLDTPLDCASCKDVEECYKETFGDYL